MEQGENHQEILQDLFNIQEQAQSIWEKIEISTNRIAEQHEETIVRYEQTMQKLVQINDTIQYIWNITNAMRMEIDQKLGWITDYIGDTGIVAIKYIRKSGIYLANFVNCKKKCYFLKVIPTN